MSKPAENLPQDMHCQDVQQDLALLVYGELSFDQEERLERHLSDCPACQQELARVHLLLNEVTEAEVPVNTALLQECRVRLRSSLGVPEQPWWRRWLDAAGTRPFWMRQAGAVGFAVAGFLVAQVPGLRVGNPAPQVAQTELARPVTQKVRYLEPGADGSVRMVVDEVYQRTVNGSLQDESIQSMLVGAVRDAESAAVRAQTIDLLMQLSLGPEVRDTLLYAVQHDESPAVRVKAVQGLRRFTASDPRTQTALVRVLMEDDSPAVRLLTVEALGQHQEAEVAGALQRLLTQEQDAGVRGSCVRTLKAMRASTDVY